MDLLQMKPQEFLDFLQVNKIQTFHFVTRGGKLVASHQVLQPICDVLCDHSIVDDYDDHEACFYQVSKSGVLQSAVVHRTCRGPAAGGVRNWVFSNMDEFFRDGLRLAKGMTHKNALAGLYWGGGKGVMIRNSGKGLMPGDDKQDRIRVYHEYGDFISSLHGCYVTAEDVGTGPDDMAAIFTKTRHTTCIPAAMGGSGNPSSPTARGLIRGLEAAFKHLNKSLHGATIAVQGCGNVGTPLIHFLFEAGVKTVYASDVDSHRKESILSTFSGRDFHLTIVSKGDNSILFADVDAVCPCATGAVLSPETIPNIKAKIICGAANNQLLNLRTDDELLKKRGILYIPDFLVNRMVFS